MNKGIIFGGGIEIINLTVQICDGKLKITINSSKNGRIFEQNLS